MIQIQSEESYNKIVEEFSDMIFRIAYQNFMNVADAEDVVQDVFVKLLRKRGITFQDDEHLKAWIIRTTINQCNDYWRAVFRKREVPLENQVIVFEDKEEFLMEEIAKLPKEDRTIIYLYYYEGYSLKEIAEIMKKKQNTVNSRLTRARKKLGKLLMEE